MVYLIREGGDKYKGGKCNGRNVIHSAILLENCAAEILRTEGDLIDKLNESNENPWKLIIINRQIRAILCCLKDIAEKIE